MPFAPKIAFVDVETTGTSPERARVTEVGVVLVSQPPRGGDHAPTVEHWESLVDPGVPVPPGISLLTGITDRMLDGAPRFADIAHPLLERLDGAVFVAHQASFDYGFIRRELGRAGVEFHAPTLCTVRLSRLLFPERSPHSLDAIIARFGLAVTDRHRALGDARVLWEFVRTLYRRLPTATVDDAVHSLIRRPRQPAPLPRDLPPPVEEAASAEPGR